MDEPIYTGKFTTTFNCGIIIFNSHRTMARVSCDKLRIIVVTMTL